MANVPVRGVPLSFASTLNVTVPLPVPLAPVNTASQVELLEAVHAQVGPVLTVIASPVPPVCPADWRVGAIAIAHSVGAASWLTVNVSPAMAIAPVRVPPVFTATVKVTLPLPVPLPLPVTVSHVSVVRAVHAHPALVVTLMGPPDPPADGNDCVLGAIAYSHDEPPTPGCRTVACWPPTVIVALRSAPTFGSALNVTVPLPVPVVVPVNVSHAALDEADQVHPLVVTLMLPVPPAFATVCVAGASA